MAETHATEHKVKLVSVSEYSSLQVMNPEETVTADEVQHGFRT
jgi:hypothetical protein